MQVGKVLDLLMDGLEELTLVFPNPGVVWLFHQPGVFVDEPRLPENVSSGVFYLRPEKEQFLRVARNYGRLWKPPETPGNAPLGSRDCRSGPRLHIHICAVCVHACVCLTHVTHRGPDPFYTTCKC